MTPALPLDRVTLAEKLAAMEAIWADLSRAPEKFSTPAWHKTLLDERKSAIRRGEASYSDWETANKRLRKKLA